MGRRFRHGGTRIANRAMKVAVTGATGFIGRHVLAELRARTIDVTAVVRQFPVAAAPLAATRVVQMDIHDPVPDAYEVMGRPEVLIHLAWSGLPNYRSPHHFERELPAQYRFLQGLVASGLPSLLVTGTCFEYGMQMGALSEQTQPLPNNPYGYAKDALRQQLECLKVQHPYRLTWARLFYIYGEGQAPNSLWPQLRQAAELGEERFNMSGGEQLRDYLSGSVVARYLVALALAKKDIGVVNVCSGRPVSVRKLVESWIEENGWAITPNLGHYPYPDYEPMAFWGDSSKIDRLLELK